MEERFDYKTSGNLFFIISILFVAVLLAAVGIYVAYSFRERGVFFMVLVAVALLALESVFIREGTKRMQRYSNESFVTDNDKLTFIQGERKREILWEDIIKLAYFNPTGSLQEFQVQSRRAGRTVQFDSSLSGLDRLISTAEKKTGRKFENQPRPLA